MEKLHFNKDNELVCVKDEAKAQQEEKPKKKSGGFMSMLMNFG